MDPIANTREQLALARAILRRVDAGEAVSEDDAVRLAELVVALAEWREAGGFAAE